MPWYAGPPLLERLETIPVEPPAVHGARLPVQLVLRGEDGTRWAAGRLAAGTLRAGDEVVVLPSGDPHARRRGPRRRRHRRAGRRAAERLGALEDEVDLARGELIAAVEDAPEPPRELTATLCWLGDQPAPRGATASCSSTAPAPSRRGSTDRRPDRVRDARLAAADELRLNDIAHVCLRLGGEIAADPYEQCHATGAFILIDEATNDTVAAGMVSLSRSIE